MSEKLALLGGPPAIPEKFPPYNPYGPEEAAAAQKVIASGVLSKFLGTWHEDFYGGEKVREFERAWAQYFQVSHAVTVNSATSGLIAAVGALGVEPGDEIVVTPWTMCATATAILVWNAIPVFADIEPETFNLAPKSLEAKITPRTRAVLVADIFGHAADLDAIMALAQKYGLKVIEDAAQAPAALYHGRYVGTIADIGVFSLNYHKHIHTGEGGVCVTHDPVLAERMQLIRNHGEAVVAGKGVTDLTNIVGFNFRLGEIEAAMGIEQLKKLKRLTDAKSRAGARLSAGLAGLQGLQTPVVKEGCTHVYYVYPLKIEVNALGVSRARIAAALRAEGVPGVTEGYTNIHLLPMYQKKVAYGRKGFPWVKEIYPGNISYEKGICPVAEDLHDRAMMGLPLCLHNYSDPETDLVIRAFHKVWNQLDVLRHLDRK
jgi:dTDP-4-amino-4,6-dideoxygalactose transaminase